jgi:hypothetical protein
MSRFHYKEYAQFLTIFILKVLYYTQYTILYSVYSIKLKYNMFALILMYILSSMGYGPRCKLLNYRILEMTVYLIMGLKGKKKARKTIEAKKTQLSAY